MHDMMIAADVAKPVHAYRLIELRFNVPLDIKCLHSSQPICWQVLRKSKLKPGEKKPTAIL